MRAGEVVPSADSSRVPTLSANRNVGYVPGQSIEFHSRNMVFEPHELDPADQKNAVAAVTNQSGMEYIHRLAGRRQDEGGMSHVASHFSPANAATLANLAKIVKPSQASRQLAGIARAAARAGKSLIVVVDHEGLPDEVKATGLNEELDHRLQSVLAGGKAAKFHLSEPASQRFTQGTPQGRTAAGTLSRYGFTTEGEAASEIGVRLMDQGRYQELDLSRPEARSLGAQYVRALRKEHGSVKPRDIAKRVFTALRSANPGSRGQSDSLPGSLRPEGRGGPAGRAGEDKSLPESDSARPPKRTFLDRQPLNRERQELPEDGQANLFGSDAERQSQVDAQRGADKLTHDQLTAQLKSGGPVKPTKLKPAETRGLFDEEGPEQGSLFDASRNSERGSLSLKSTKTPEQAQAERDQRFAKNLRERFTGRRDFWGARVHQITARLRRDLPSHVDREGLYLMRDMRNHPGELEQWLDGTHEGYRDVQRIDIARDNIEKLRPAIERAMNPTPKMLEADKELTKIAERTLREGQRLGMIDQHVDPSEYVTHLLQSPDELRGGGKLEDLGRAVGGKIGLNFPYNQTREFPTILEAIAHNQRPRTLDALAAFDRYGDKFATARATHVLIHQLRESDTGIWGSRKDKGIPRDWVEIAPHAHVFRDPVAYLDAEGKPASAYRTLFVPRKIEAGLRPITDPAYMNKVAGFYAVRGAQAYTKAAQLGLSFFHATTENYMALANMGARGWLKGLKADRDAPGFLEQEADFIGHGGTTSVQGKAYEAAEGLTLSSLPTAGEAWRSMAGVRHVERAAKAITDLTFGKLQRQFKVVDYSLHQAAWLAKHPNAMPSEREAAMRSISKEINAVYGGLHSENLGMNKSTQDVARAIMLAPDWTLANLFNLKYAAEGGTPAGKMARLFWLRAIVGGMVGTQLMSLLLSGKLSKRPDAGAPRHGSGRQGDLSEPVFQRRSGRPGQHHRQHSGVRRHRRPAAHHGEQRGPAAAHLRRVEDEPEFSGPGARCRTGHEPRRVDGANGIRRGQRSGADPVEHRQ